MADRLHEGIRFYYGCPVKIDLLLYQVFLIVMDAQSK